MPGRRILIIGTQWNNAPNRLSFLPDVAARLHKLMTEGPGDCVGAWLGVRRPGLLLDPTVKEAKDAIRAAINGAAEAEEPLILAYVGHGEFTDERSGDFYLMPTDATERTQDGAIHLAEFIKDRIRHAPGLGGLVVLLDACFAGAGAWQAMERWAQVQRGKLKFEFLTATSDTSTGDAPLFRALIEILERGDPELGDQITCGDIHEFLERNIYAEPQHDAYNARKLTLGRNIAKDPGDVFWKDSLSRPLILKATEYLQPTPQLAQLVEASRSHPVIILTGESGVGKSTLAAALARPELTGGLVPVGFVHAVAMIDNRMLSQDLAVDLERQLIKSVPAFKDVMLDQRDVRDPLRKKVLEPLKHLKDAAEVRIVLDGFNEFSDATREAVGKAFTEAFETPPPHLRLILTAHPNTPDSPPGEHLDFEKPSPKSLAAYLESRRVPDLAQSAILAKAQRSWLLTRLLADTVLTDPGFDLKQLPDNVADAYAKRLGQAVGEVTVSWNNRFHPVLATLTVASPGPILPLPLLVRASGLLGGPDTEEGVRSILTPLRGLTVRANAGTPTEHVGLFHPTLVEYLLDSSAIEAGYAIDAPAAHRSLIDAIDALAPSANHQRDDSLHRYAFRREAHHLWASGEADQTLKCLAQRESNTPRENLERLSEWLPRFTDRLGINAPKTLALRSDIAYWIGECGAPGAALELFKVLLPDQERTLGKNHVNTLTTRGNIAACTGQNGDPGTALELFKALLSDQERTLGNDHPNTLTTRNNIAGFTGQNGAPHAALELFKALLSDQERTLGNDHPDTLATRNSIAAFTGQNGDPGAALKLFKALLPDRERVLGEDHPNTLTTRYNIAAFTGQNGDPGAALELFKALLPDQERTLGENHPDTLATRYNIAACTGQNGDPGAALELFEALLPDRERVLGENHPDALATRYNIAYWTGECGDPRTALELFKALLPDRERVLGEDHPDTLATRGCIAGYTGRSGDPGAALELFKALLLDRERVLGKDHPNTLNTRGCIAGYTGQNGDPHTALELFKALLPDQEGALGDDHPDTLNTAGIIGGMTIVLDEDRSEGCRHLREAMERAEKRYGPDHALTLELKGLVKHFACD